MMLFDDYPQEGTMLTNDLFSDGMTCRIHATFKCSTKMNVDHNKFTRFSLCVCIVAPHETDEAS